MKSMDDFELEDNYAEKLYDEYDEEEDEELSLEREDNIIKVLDPDLIEYFNEAQVIKKKTFNSKTKKSKKDREIYPAGTPVKFQNQQCTVLYGPYDLDGKDMYELETTDGNVISGEYSKIQKLS